MLVRRWHHLRLAAVHERAFDILRHAFLAPFFSHTNGADNPAGMASLPHTTLRTFLGRGDDRVKSTQGLIAAWQKRA